MKLFTPAVISALDRTKTTDRNAWHIIAAVVSALGHDANFVPSHSTIRRHRIERRKQIANDLKQNLQTASSLVVHWDSKMLPDIVGKTKVDRLPILISGLNTQQLLAVPKLEQSTGINQALIIIETLNEWNITERVKAMCFDTPSVNTGDYNGTCVLLEKQLNKKLLYLACRHHIFELVLRSVAECVWPVTKSPNVAIFERFRNKWHTMDQNKFVTGLEDKFISDVIESKRTEILQDIQDRLQIVLGIGMPIPLGIKQSMAIGWNFQWQYPCATNISVFHDWPKIVARSREKREDQPSDRAMAYAGFEEILDRQGIDGRQCLLRSICENAVYSTFHEANGLYGQLVHIALTPDYGDREVDPDLDPVYLEAQRAGEYGVDCQSLYQECNYKNGLLDIISVLDNII